MSSSGSRVVVVDDHPLFRDGVRAAFATVDDLVVVGEAESADQAMAVIREVRPDVVLMDLQLPDGSGIDVTRSILQESPGTRILVMTMTADDDAVVSAMRVGARGYVVKGSGRDELLQAVRTVAAGGAVFSASVADRLGDYFGSLATLPGRDAFPQLSDREREVLDLLARGFDNKRIARELFLSDKTVRNHVSNVLTKLGVEDRTEAMTRARAAGLGQP